MLWRCFHFRLGTARVLSFVVLILLVTSLFVVVVREVKTKSPDVVDRLTSAKATTGAPGSGDGKMPDVQDPTSEWSDPPMIVRDPDVTSRGGEDAGRQLAEPAMTLINIDLRVGPIFALKETLRKFGVRIVDKSLSPFCHLTDTCSDLEIVNETVILDSRRSARNEAGLAFWRRYRDDPEFRDADGFLCVHPTWFCQWLERFRKSVLVLVMDDRYEIGDPETNDWTRRVVERADAAGSLVLTTNPYDREYVKYFTHVSLPVVPYACDYVTDRYLPSRSSYLVLTPLGAEGDALERAMLARFEREVAWRGLGVGLRSVRALYGWRYKTSDLIRHAGLVIVPGRVSSVALTEILRLEMPLFLPSIELLVRWHVQYGVLERFPGRVEPHQPRRAPSDRLQHDARSSNRSTAGDVPDPDDEENEWAIGFWLTYSDFYDWPSAGHFDSVEHLALLLNSTTGEHLYYTNQRASVFNSRQKADVNNFWRAAIDRLTSAKRQHVVDDERTD